MKPRPYNEYDRILEAPEYAVIRDIADQMDLLAYLVAKAAEPTDGHDTRPRAVDLHLPHAGLNALLRSWSDQLLDALDVTDQTLPTGPAQAVRKVRA